MNVTVKNLINKYLTNINDECNHFSIILVKIQHFSVRPNFDRSRKHYICEIKKRTFIFLFF